MSDVLAQDYQELAESPDPQNVFAGSPALAKLRGGRLVATHDWFRTGPDKEKVPNQGRVLTSDDGGRTWTKRASTDLMWASPFKVGQVLYLIGNKRGGREIARYTQGPQPVENHQPPAPTAPAAILGATRSQKYPWIRVSVVSSG